MDDLGKLRHHIEHWLEHNEGHKGTYLEWAAKADSLGKPALAATLREVASQTDSLGKLLARAIEESR